MQPNDIEFEIQIQRYAATRYKIQNTYNEIHIKDMFVIFVNQFHVTILSRDFLSASSSSSHLIADSEACEFQSYL